MASTRFEALNFWPTIAIPDGNVFFAQGIKSNEAEMGFRIVHDGRVREQYKTCI